jgi:hypothetical protein
LEILVSVMLGHDEIVSLVFFLGLLLLISEESFDLFLLKLSLLVELGLVLGHLVFSGLVVKGSQLLWVVGVLQGFLFDGFWGNRLEVFLDFLVLYVVIESLFVNKGIHFVTDCLFVR